MSSPAQTLYITHRRMKKADGHEHVGWVRLLGGLELSRKKILEMIDAEIGFVTLAEDGTSAKMIKATCPRCIKPYLRTETDHSKADNLDELPLF